MTTSVVLIAKMLPNMKEFTSVFRPLVREVIKIPIASEELEIRAIAESPFMFEDELTRSRRKAARTQTGVETARGAQLKARAMAIVPNPT